MYEVGAAAYGPISVIWMVGGVQICFERLAIHGSKFKSFNLLIHEIVSTIYNFMYISLYHTLLIQIVFCINLYFHSKFVS